MTKEAAISMSYLYAAELLKEAAEEQGVDLDDEAQNMSDEEMGDLLDGTVADLEEAGELDAIISEIDEDEPEANFGSYEDGETEVDEDLEAEAGFFMAKTAALLEKAAKADETGFDAAKYEEGRAAHANNDPYRKRAPNAPRSAKAAKAKVRMRETWNKRLGFDAKKGKYSRPRAPTSVGASGGSRFHRVVNVLRNNKKLAIGAGAGLLAAGGGAAYLASRRKKG